MRKFLVATGATMLMFSAAAKAETIQIQVENTLPDGNFFLTPVWVAAHDGGFDSYDGGSPAPAFLTPLAEDGITGDISAAFAASASGVAGGVDATITAVAAPGDAPVFSPGESTTFSLNVGDATVNRFFSYASMIVPSNDLFIANGNPVAHELFDAAGNFNGPIVISVLGGAVNDNGTELNDANGGAAFSANGGTSTDESENIRNFFTVADDSDYLASFIGSDTANGATISNAFGANDLVARITITPEPSSLTLLALAGLAALRRR